MVQCHRFLFGDGKLHHPREDAEALSPVSEHMTSILNVLCYRTRCSAYDFCLWQLKKRKDVSIVDRVHIKFFPFFLFCAFFLRVPAETCPTCQLSGAEGLGPFQRPDLNPALLPRSKDLLVKEWQCRAEQDRRSRLEHRHWASLAFAPDRRCMTP